MASVSLRLLRAARKASLASRAAAVAASRAAAMASRSSRADAAAIAAADAARLGSRVIAPLKSCPTRRDATAKPPDDAPRRPMYFIGSDFAHVPDDAKAPTEKDLVSDEAVWALYERWCKAFNKELDHAEMARRFKLFKHRAKFVHHWNTYLPPDPEEAAIYIQKRREAKLLISKGEDVSDFDDCYLRVMLGPFAHGEEPFMSERSKRLLKKIEDGYDPFSAQQSSLGNEMK